MEIEIQMRELEMDKWRKLFNKARTVISTVNRTIKKAGPILAVLSFAITIATLLYFRVEVIKNTNALEQQEYGALKEQQQEIWLFTAENTEVYTKALLDPESLSDRELWMVSEIIFMRLEMLDRFQHAYDNHILPKSELELEFSLVPIFLGTEIGEEVWENIKPDYGLTSDFVKKIEENLKYQKANTDGAIRPDDVFLKSLIAKRNVKDKNLAPSSY